jgi:hypothetical protein
MEVPPRKPEPEEALQEEPPELPEEWVPPKNRELGRGGSIGEIEQRKGGIGTLMRKKIY